MDMIRRELKEKFLRDLTHSEKLLFLKIAREAITRKGYQAGEDLFHYCYFLTLKERLRGMDLREGDGYMRVLLVEGSKEMEHTVRMYEETLEKRKLPAPDPEGQKFIEYFSEQGDDA